MSGPLACVAQSVLDGLLLGGCCLLFWVLVFWLACVRAGLRTTTTHNARRTTPVFACIAMVKKKDILLVVQGARKGWLPASILPPGRWRLAAAGSSQAQPATMHYYDAWRCARVLSEIIC
jgi:hypothetical protein